MTTASVEHRCIDVQSTIPDNSMLTKEMLSKDTVNFIGLCAGAMTTISFLPQLMATYRSKSAHGMSYGYLLTFSGGVILWLLYGIFLHAPPVILTNAVTLGLLIVITALKVRYKT